MKHELNDFKMNITLELEEMKKKFEMLETKVNHLEEVSTNAEGESFHPDVSIVALNLPETENERLMDKTIEMFKRGLGLNDIVPVRVLRLKSHNKNPGVVKIQCHNKEEKIAVLRAKQNLKDVTAYKRVFLRTSMTHSERLARINFETILREIPGGHRLRIAGNGKLIVKNDQEENTTTYNGEDSETPRFSMRGRGRGRGRARGQFRQFTRQQGAYEHENH
jgi:hypothetical protein